MPFEIIPHTADVRMRCSGSSRDALFHDAVLGTVAMMQPTGREGDKGVTRAIAVASPDTTSLLVDLLNEVLAWMHTRREAYTDVVFNEIAPGVLEVHLTGYVAQGFGEDVKAATYHEVEVKENGAGSWGATIVFDI